MGPQKEGGQGPGGRGKGHTEKTSMKGHTEKTRMKDVGPQETEKCEQI